MVLGKGRIDRCRCGLLLVCSRCRQSGIVSGGGHAGIVDEVWCGVGSLGGADIIALGIQVSFDGCRGHRWVSTEGLGVKAWDGLKVAGIDGFL